MRTLQIKLFTFDELSNEAKENAIKQVRESYYEYNDFCQWAIDDCALLEPLENELTEILGKDYKFPLLKNTRKKLYFSLDRNRFIDISNAMMITDDDDFLKWLEIDKNLFLDNDGFLILDYKIGKDTIEFETNDFNIDFSNEQNKILDIAIEKFESHCNDILARIESGYEYRFTDEAIIQDIEATEMEFEKDGTEY